MHHMFNLFSLEGFQHNFQYFTPSVRQKILYRVCAGNVLGLKSVFIANYILKVKITYRNLALLVKPPEFHKIA
jgi:hypothetical protein